MISMLLCPNQSAAALELPPRPNGLSLGGPEWGIFLVWEMGQWGRRKPPPGTQRARRNLYIHLGQPR
jgi:hypothetical protein